MKKSVMKAEDIYDQIHSLKNEVSDLTTAIDELTDYGDGPSGRKSVEILEKVRQEKHRELSYMLSTEWERTSVVVDVNNPPAHASVKRRGPILPEVTEEW